MAELAPEKTVFRLVRQTNRFIPPGAKFPNREAFEPSDQEKDDATTSGNPVRVSVWDRDRTTVTQATAARFEAAGRMSAFAVTVATIHALRERMSNPRLRVVEDPLPELVDVPGGEGHCGIEGLDREPGRPRQAHKALLDELAQSVRLLDEQAA